MNIPGLNADIYYGQIDESIPDWQDLLDEPDPDDEQLEQTPRDVVEILGFDPADERE